MTNNTITEEKGLRIQFKPLTTTDLPLLFAWLDVPHVKEWWRETRDYQEFVKKYTKWIEVDDVGPYLIYNGMMQVHALFAQNRILPQPLASIFLS
jgi:hypothetical protein